MSFVIGDATRRVITLLSLLGSVFLCPGCVTLSQVWEAVSGHMEDSPPSQSSDIPEPVKMLHADVSGWEKTATLHASVSGSKIILNYDKARIWPARERYGVMVNANPWVFVQKDDGIWYGATFEWLRPGQTSKPLATVNGAHIKGMNGIGVRVRPLLDFEPISGETYYFMVSGLARDAARNVQERSNAVPVVWP